MLLFREGFGLLIVLLLGLTLLVCETAALKCYQCDADFCETVTCGTLDEPACYDIRVSLKSGIFIRGSGCIEHKSCKSTENYYKELLDDVTERHPEDMQKFHKVMDDNNVDIKMTVHSCCKSDLCNSDSAASLA